MKREFEKIYLGALLPVLVGSVAFWLILSAFGKKQLTVGNGFGLQDTSHANIAVDGQSSLSPDRRGVTRGTKSATRAQSRCLMC